MPKNMIFVNKAAFDALDTPTKDAMLKRPRPPRTRGWKVSQEKTKWYTDQLAAKGMKVLPPSPELKAGSRRSASSSPPTG